MSHDTPSTHPLYIFLFGGLFVVVGALMALLGIGVLPVPSRSLHAVRWVIVALGAAFFLGGLLVITQLFLQSAGRRKPFVLWLQYLFTLGFLASFTGVVIWMGFGSGEREFSGNVGPILVTEGSASQLIGRLVFGGFGVLLVAVTLWYAIVQPLHLLGIWSPPWLKREDFLD